MTNLVGCYPTRSRFFQLKDNEKIEVWTGRHWQPLRPLETTDEMHTMMLVGGIPAMWARIDGANDWCVMAPMPAHEMLFRVVTEPVVEEASEEEEV